MKLRFSIFVKEYKKLKPKCPYEKLFIGVSSGLRFR
jgi:hypothetical protein